MERRLQKYDRGCARSSLQLRHLDWVFAWFAYAAEQRSRRDNRLGDAAPIAVQRDDMRHLAGVLLADRAPAEDAGAVRGPLAVPAVHCYAPLSVRSRRVGVF